MGYYAQLGATGKVHTVCELNNRMVEIETNDARLIGTIYDEATGQFVGYRIELTADKSEVIADGVEEALITATVYNWDGAIAESYAGEITFEVSGIQVGEPVVNGVASIPFSSAEAGTYTIQTVNSDAELLSNGRVEVLANVQVIEPVAE